MFPNEYAAKAIAPVSRLGVNRFDLKNAWGSMDVNFRSCAEILFRIFPFPLSQKFDQEL